MIKNVSNENLKTEVRIIQDHNLKRKERYSINAFLI